MFELVGHFKVGGPFTLGGTGPLDPESKVREASDLWRGSLVDASRQEAALAAKRNVSLGDIHPGGLAQLYSDHPTLLRNLIREPDALERANAATLALHEFAEGIRRKHGHVTVHFAAGVASWGGRAPASNIPVLMRRVSITRDEAGDFMFSLLPGVEVNSRLLNELALARSGLDRTQLGDALRSPHGFSPAAALDLIREVGWALPEFELKDALSIGVYTHPTSTFYRELGATKTLSESSVVAALAGHSPAERALDVALPAPEGADRDPWRELGLGDQTPETLDAVEVVAGGSSVTVETEPAVDIPQVTASFAGALASIGKSVLVVSNDAEVRRELMSKFEAEGVSKIVVEFDGDQAADEAATLALREALQETESDLNVEEVDHLRTELRRASSALSSYTGQLHENFEKWGVSAFDALQVLTDLTSLSTPPTTRVRLGEQALSALTTDSGLAARELLEEADSLGVFSGGSGGAWMGAELSDPVQVERVLLAVDALSDEGLPMLREQILEFSERTDLPAAVTLDEWRQQLEVLVQSQKVLDVFKPEVFERSPADMIVATATPAWRKDRSIALKRSKRRQLVKQAKDLLRPGVHVEDLHSSLKTAQEARQAWVTATGRRREAPIVPDGLPGYTETLAEVDSELDAIKPYLEPVYGDLDTLHLDGLEQMLRNLASARDDARAIPDQNRVLAALDEIGLTPLVNDFRERNVTGEQLGLELDLSWWASALGYMLAAEPRLGGFSAADLQDHLATFRALDKRHVDLLGAVAVDRVLERRAESIELYPDQVAAVTDALDRGESARRLFAEFSLPWDLLPIVVTAPALVPTVVKLGHKVDTVVTVGMEDLPAGLMVPILARGRSVVAVSSQPTDTSGGTEGEEQSWLEALREVLPNIHLGSGVTATNSVLASVIAAHDPDRQVMGVPSPSPTGDVELVVVEGSATPSPGTLAIESSAGEVDAVLDVLADTLAESPDESVGVVAFSKRHGDRIADALSRRAGEDAGFADLIEQAGGADNLIFTPEQLMKVRPSHTILAVGFTKTPHGRVIHDFGVLSTKQGMDVFEQVARGTPRKLTIVSTLSAADIDRERLRQPGALALYDLLDKAQKLEDAAEAGEVSWPVTEQAPDELLVDLADRLHQMGLNVVPNLGGEGSLRIPLAIGHPEVPGQLLVAVLTDDEDYLSEPSLRTRDRHTVEVLEEAGWRVRTQLSMAVFIDPNREVDKIIELVLDAVDVHYARLGLPNTPGAAAILAGEDPDTVQAEEFRPVTRTAEQPIVEILDTRDPDALDEEAAEDGDEDAPAGEDEVDEAGEVDEANEAAETPDYLTESAVEAVEATGEDDAAEAPDYLTETEVEVVEGAEEESEETVEKA